MNAGAPEGWQPPFASEEDVAGLRPDPEGLGQIIGPAVAREFRRAGGELPTIGRLVSAIVGAMEADPWLQEIEQNAITAENALLLAQGIHEETVAVLNGQPVGEGG